MAVPVSMLRARGVHTVYYQLEPLGSYGPNPMARCLTLTLTLTLWP